MPSMQFPQILRICLITGALSSSHTIGKLMLPVGSLTQSIGRLFLLGILFLAIKFAVNFFGFLPPEINSFLFVTAQVSKLWRAA
jgi:hypothetical protein